MKRSLASSEEERVGLIKSSHMQLVHASSFMPKRARSEFALMVHPGTRTPLGARLLTRLAGMSSFGMGLRARTLRNKAPGFRSNGREML